MVEKAGDFFEAGVPTFVARAPGRLDVVGGIADYSGSLVLQLPLSLASFAACQMVSDGRSEVVVRSPPRADVRVPSQRLESVAGAREAFQGDSRWAAYAVGALATADRKPPSGSSVRLFIRSTVPEGAGVSSSAAVAVSCSAALTAALLPTSAEAVPSLRLAACAQAAENGVAGAPCGFMDHAVAAAGLSGRLLQLRCQPVELLGFAELPRSVAIWGIDSGVRHSVAGDAYAVARIAAFAALGKVQHKNASVKTLCSLSSADCEKLLQDVPDYLGYEELAEPHPDEVAHPSAKHPRYPLRSAAAHATGESERAARFAEILERMHKQESCCAAEKNGQTGRLKPEKTGTAAPCSPVGTPPLNALDATSSWPWHAEMVSLAEMLASSHRGYSAVGLGSPNADRIVELVAAERAEAESRGVQPALYGARITGGGCGGTVCVLGRAGSEGEAAVRRVADAYAIWAGKGGFVFSGSSDGAAAYGTYRVLDGQARRVRALAHEAG